MFRALMLCGMLGISMSVAAVPAKRDTLTVNQSDGTRLRISLRGDEFAHGFQTLDGLRVAQGADGDYYYRTAAGLSAVRAHEPEARGAEEQAFIASSRESLNINKQLNKVRSVTARRARAARKVSQVPSSGTPKVPILLVQYKDVKMVHDLADFQEHYMTGDSSAYRYFVDQSDGAYKPQFETHGIYTLSQKRAYYGGNDSEGNDSLVAALVGEAVDLAAAAGVDFSQYDNDGDGECDVVIVVYAGAGEAQGADANTIWPCQWNLTAGEYYGDGDGPRTYNNTTIDKFAVFNENRGRRESKNSKLDGIGTFCHEFSHCLDLPDFYPTTDEAQKKYYGMGSWSLMDYGCYNNDGDTPIGYSAYEKNFMGWLDLTDPTENTVYTLSPLNGGEKSGDAVKIVSDVNSNEYFILENRARKGWDGYIADEGLLVHHYSYDDESWYYNTINNNEVQLATILPADGKTSEKTEDADCYPYEGNDSITDNSKPATVLYLNENGTATGNAGYLGKPVTEITMGSNGDVSFWYMKKVTTGIQLVPSVETGAATEEYYDLQGRKIARPVRGVYITRGKKVLIK